MRSFSTTMTTFVVTLPEPSTSRPALMALRRACVDAVAVKRPAASKREAAPAATPRRGHADPRRGVSERSRRGWGPGASGKKLAESVALLGCILCSGFLELACNLLGQPLRRDDARERAE